MQSGLERVPRLAWAADYITKPVEINQLLSLMRLWLDR